MNEEAITMVESLRVYLVKDIMDYPYAVHTTMHMAADLIESLSAQLEQVTRERDTAVEDLREADRVDCEHCIAHMQYASECDEADYICADCDKMCRCRTCRNNSNWQWRGLKVEG